MTNTTRFLLPGLRLPFKQLLDLGFVDAFLYDDDYDREYKQAIFLLFKVENNTLMAKFLYEYKLEILDEYDPLQGYTVIVFQFPEKYKQIYEFFLEGKYSSFTAEYISLFPPVENRKRYECVEDGEIIGLTIEKSFPTMVCLKNNNLREIWNIRLGATLDNTTELWSKYEKKDETINYQKLLK